MYWIKHRGCEGGDARNAVSAIEGLSHPALAPTQLDGVKILGFGLDIHEWFFFHVHVSACDTISIDIT